MEQSPEQVTDTLLMVRPAGFAFNAETAGSNIFQTADNAADRSLIHAKALEEFDALVKKLRQNKVYVIILQDPGVPATPDSIFPNNWISFHKNEMVLYPMLAANRRQERRNDWVHFLKTELQKHRIIDLTKYENEQLFLEGTGSLVLDRIHQVAYANRSSRTSEKLLNAFAQKMNYEVISFLATDFQQREIYHTNVVMAMGEKTVVICAEVIRDLREREQVLERLNISRDVVAISEEQMIKFAGNMLMVKNREGERFWIMSQQARDSLSPAQIKTLQSDGEIISADLQTIETYGGGSARCMLAEVF